MDCSCPSSRFKAFPTSWPAQPPSRSSRHSFPGRLLSRLGPVRVAPALFASNAALFLVEWVLLGWRPSAAAVLLFFHSTVLGAIAISSFWSLLNERFDAHSAKRLMARVAGAATFGGLIGGVGAERVAALFPQGTLLPILGFVGVIPVAGALALGSGAPVSRTRAEDEPDLGGGWTQIRNQPLLRNLAGRHRPRGDAHGAR